MVTVSGKVTTTTTPHAMELPGAVSRAVATSSGPGFQEQACVTGLPGVGCFLSNS